MRSIQYNNFSSEQKEFIDYILQSHKQERCGVITLNAPAGTGKTTCINYIIDKLNLLNCVLAPTRKAASLFGKGAATTLHSYFHLFPKYSESGELVFGSESQKCPMCKFTIPDVSEISVLHEHVVNCKPQAPDEKNKKDEDEDEYEEDKKYKMLFIDECSMVSIDMLPRLLDESRYSLIVFCGDDAQIPPIKEEFSRTFNYPYTIKSFSFTKSMRAKNDKIRSTNDKFRNAISTASNNPRPHYVEKVNAYGIVEDIKHGRDSIMLSFANSQKDLYNYMIRKALYMDDKTELKELYEGERMIYSGYRNTEYEHSVYKYCETMKLPDTPEWLKKSLSKLLDYTLNVIRLVGKSTTSLYGQTYGTSDMITIKNINTYTIELPYYACPHQSELNTTNKPLLKKCKACNIKGKNKTHETVTYYEFVDERGTIWRKVAKQSLEEFESVMTYFREYILSQKVKSALWMNYYTIKYWLNPVLEYNYSITIHKSQGSQYDNVYVNIDNVRRNGYLSNEMKARLLYTAVSRAMCNVYFVDSA